MRKNNCHISFPLLLDIAPYCTQQCIVSEYMYCNRIEFSYKHINIILKNNTITEYWLCLLYMWPTPQFLVNELLSLSCTAEWVGCVCMFEYQMYMYMSVYVHVYLGRAKASPTLVGRMVGCLYIYNRTYTVSPRGYFNYLHSYSKMRNFWITPNIRTART